MKSAYYDPNPVVILEHKGLYWSKIKGTENAKTIEPSEDYVIPFGKARIVLKHDIKETNTIFIITYGISKLLGYKRFFKDHNGKVEVVDLRMNLSN